MHSNADNLVSWGKMQAPCLPGQKENPFEKAYCQTCICIIIQLRWLGSKNAHGIWLDARLAWPRRQVSLWFAQHSKLIWALLTGTNLAGNSGSPEGLGRAGTAWTKRNYKPSKLEVTSRAIVQSILPTKLGIESDSMMDGKAHATISDCLVYASTLQTETSHCWEP